MKRTILAIACVLFISHAIYSQQVSRDEAVNVAKRSMIVRGFEIQTLQVDTVFQLESKGKVLLYEILFHSGHSVLLSGNKKCKPVLGYSTTSDGNSCVSLLDNIESLPCCLGFYINSLVLQVESNFSVEQDVAMDSEWQRLQYDGIQNRNTIVVSPLLSTEWGQSVSNDNIDEDAYNYYVEESGTNCDRCSAGCGPVAMAQLMRYWNYPICLENLIQQFDWCNMPNGLYTNDPNYGKQRKAIAYLIRNCGEVLSAQYCIHNCATQTSLQDVAGALHYYAYGCDNYALKPTESSGLQQWKNKMKQNLDRGMPIYYYGLTGNSEGHFFVCDGYDSDAYFHFNWGWNGNWNNYWFTIDNLNPGYSFNYTQGAVFNIKPLYTQDMCDYALLLEDYYRAFYNAHQSSNDPEYSVSPSTMTTLISAPATAPATYRTIPSGATAEYVAHEEVVLQPGFTAEYGSDFTARIEKCEACENRMLQVELLGDYEADMFYDTTAYMRHIRRGDTTYFVSPSRLTIFPNPADHTVTLKDLGSYSDIMIFDMLGRIVNNWSIVSSDSDNITLNIERFQSSTYLIRVVTSDGKIHIARFLKQ